MTPGELVVPLLLLHAALGGFDTLVNHEWRARLPATPGAAPELRLHAMRSGLFAGLFAAYAAGTWHGLWALLPLALSCVEIGVTARDTVVEFRLRSVDALERIAHLLLLVNTGAYTMAIGLAVSEETGLARAGSDTGHTLLALAAAVALASAARDARAAASGARLERSRTRCRGSPAGKASGPDADRARAR